MKLAAKLILIFMVGVLAIVSLFAWQTIRRQYAWEEHRRATHANHIAQTLSPTIEKAFRDGGVLTVRQAIEVFSERMTGPEVRWLDEKQTVPRRITSRRTSSITVSDANGNRIAYSQIPIQLDDDMAGTVEVAESMQEQDAFVWDSMKMSLLSLFGVAALSAGVIYFGGVRLVGKPLETLTQQVHSIGNGQLAQPAVLQSRDELGDLAAAISQMSHRLSEQRDAIRHTDRLGTVGTLAAGMAHELGTPLNVVSGRAGLIAGGKLSDAEVVASAQTIKSEAQRMTTIIRQLLDFARQTPSRHERVNLIDVIDSTCDLMRPLARKANVTIETTNPSAPLWIDADAGQIQQVLTNLIGNAVGAMPDGGSVQIDAMESDDPSRVQVRVTDNGCGIDPKNLPKIFEPFFTTKDVGQGTGLGLSIAYGIIREHGGSIHADSHPGEGTCFTIMLPTSEAEQQDDSKPSSPPKPSA